MKIAIYPTLHNDLLTSKIKLIFHHYKIWGIIQQKERKP